MTTKKLKHGGGKCAVCGTEIDRRAKHCRAHMTGGLTTQSARSLTTKTHRDNLRRKWLIEALLALPNATTPLANPAAVLGVLLEAFEQKPVWSVRPAFEIAEAYAIHEFPAAGAVYHSRFAAVIDRIVTGIRDIYVPEQDVELCNLALHNQIAERLPARTLAQIVVDALVIACFDSGHKTALDSVQRALAENSLPARKLLTMPTGYASIR